MTEQPFDYPSLTCRAQLYLPLAPFVEVHDGDGLARTLANRHYSRQWRGTPASPLFVGPGERMLLLEPGGGWLFVWRRCRYRRDSQEGVECSLFRREHGPEASEIIRLAEHAWDAKYGPTRKFTYVHPRRIRSSNPGYCFLQAGWVRHSRRSTRGLVLLSKSVPREATGEMFVFTARGKEKTTVAKESPMRTAT